MLLAAAPPAASARLAGEAERLKPCAEMVTAMVTVLVAVPEVPLTVTVYFPEAAALLIVKVMELIPALALTVANDAVTPAGTPDAAKLTQPVKPL